jgi:multidrug efflux system membrane fusion protein
MDDVTLTAVPGNDTEPGLRQRALPPPTRARPRRTLRRIVAVLLLIGLGLALYPRLRMHWAGPQANRNVSAVQSPPQPVGAATSGLGDIRIIVNALGTVTPVSTISLTTQISGELTEVRFKEGQHVKKGDFLAQIDPRPYEAAVEQAEGQLIRDQGLLDQARMDSARYLSLTKMESIARQQAEDQAFVVKQYEGAVKADQAQVEAQKTNLIYCRIVSPIDGRVGLRLVDSGNYVQVANATQIAVITQMQPITVIFPVPEDDLPQIQEQLRAGKTLEVMIYDRANISKLATGKVVALDSQIDTTTGTVKLRAEFDNADENLFPNQFVNARLLVRTLHDVVTAPIAAVQGFAPSTYVYLINADDTVSVRTIKLGTTDGEMVQVESGLAPGDRVVVDGADRLRDGARVTIRGEGSQRDPGSPDQPAKQSNPSLDAAQR